MSRHGSCCRSCYMLPALLTLGGQGFGSSILVMDFNADCITGILYFVMSQLCLAVAVMVLVCRASSCHTCRHQSEPSMLTTRAGIWGALPASCTFGVMSKTTLVACICTVALQNPLFHAVDAGRVLERWLCEGVVHDPYGEFMIQEHKVCSKPCLACSRLPAKMPDTYGRVIMWSCVLALTL